MTAIEKLMAKVPVPRQAPIGITSADIALIEVTPEVVALVIEAIQSPDILLGLFFATYLNGVHPAFAEIARTRLGDTNPRVRAGSCAVIAQHGRHLRDYRDQMLTHLRDPDPVVRSEALSAYPTYARPKEIEPLLPFEQDDYTTEVGMGSHLIFGLRNQALETAEAILGVTFPKSNITARLPDRTLVYWWDWAPLKKSRARKWF